MMSIGYSVFSGQEQEAERKKEAERSKEARQNFLVTMRLWETRVPIPNTAVKTQAVEGTWLVTAWENRWLPGKLFMWMRANRLRMTEHSLHWGGEATALVIVTPVAEGFRVRAQKQEVVEVTRME